MDGASFKPLSLVLEQWDDVVHRWSLDPFELAALMGGYEPGPLTEVATYRLVSGEMRIRLFVEMSHVLRRSLVDDHRVRWWLRAANAGLAGRTPLQVMGETPNWTRWFIENLGAAA